MPYCGKCGADYGSCEHTRGSMVIGGERRTPVIKPIESAGSTVKKFNQIAMSDGETPVRCYCIGTMKLFGSGRTDVLITNRRVILKSESNYFFMSTNTLQEVSIESINGTGSYFTKGFKTLFVFWGVILLILGFVLMNTYGIPSGYFIGIIALILGFVLLASSRRPSYIFYLNAADSGSAMSTSVNMNGVRRSNHGTGVVLTFKPTNEVITMMLEIGACVMDIKAKGDYMLPKWKNV